MPVPADSGDSAAWPAGMAGASVPTIPTNETCQAQFHRRWGHLNDGHVRALAWLLDAPDLLDARSPRWQNKVATLHIDIVAVRLWLASLDAAPQVLHAWLNPSRVTRLGRYAEKLMAFYFSWCGTLVAHGLQVRATSGETVGEFDFLLQDGGALLHMEFATKFYLFETSAGPLEEPLTGGTGAENFIGPNLADTLDAKMHKILNRQLALSAHPAAQAYLPQPVSSGQALIKGWLFYHDGTLASPAASGVSMAHCRGFWCSLSELDKIDGDWFMLLPRLAWLAPAQAAVADMFDRPAMARLLEAHFANDAMPVMLAQMQMQIECGAGVVREVGRGFVVPDDWRLRARERNQRTVLRLGTPPDNF